VESLLDSFARNRLADGLPAAELQQMLSKGNAILLFDGIDELGSASARAALRAAVWKGMRLYPDCHFVFTSRLTGYDEVPFDKGIAIESATVLEFEAAGTPGFTSPEHFLPRSIVHRDLKPSNIFFSRREPPVIWDFGLAAAPFPRIERLFVAPFDNGQIAAFCQSWYRLREPTAAEAGRRASDLIRAIGEHSSTRKPGAESQPAYADGSHPPDAGFPAAWAGLAV